MKKVLMMLMICQCYGVLASEAAVQTIVAHENSKYFYKGDRIEKSEGQYEITYQLDIENNTLTRTRLYDYQSQKITADDTVYQMDKDMNSHPTHAMGFNLPPVIHAVARLNPDTMEMLVISDADVYTTTSTTDQLVLSHAKRIK